MSREVDNLNNLVSDIAKLHESKYTVLSNAEKEEHFIGGLFPSIILLDNQTKKPLFILEVKRNGGIAQCLQQWKSFGTPPVALFLIVPEQDLSTSKSIAQALGLRVGFGTYSFDENGRVKVTYVGNN